MWSDGMSDDSRLVVGAPTELCGRSSTQQCANPAQPAWGCAAYVALQLAASDVNSNVLGIVHYYPSVWRNAEMLIKKERRDYEYKELLKLN